MSPRSYLKLLLRNNNPHYYAGHPHSRPASRMYVAYPVQKHETGSETAQGVVQARIQIPPQRKGIGRKSRYSSGEIPNMHFCEGCFWHGYKGCPIFVLHKTNVEFWLAKIENNRERDLRDYTFWESRGWRVIVVWECEMAKADFRHTVSEI